MVLQTPGSESDLDSLRAELSGHYAVLSGLEVIEQMMISRNLECKGTIIIKCDNMTSLNIFDHNYV